MSSRKKNTDNVSPVSNNSVQTTDPKKELFRVTGVEVGVVKQTSQEQGKESFSLRLAIAARGLNGDVLFELHGQDAVLAMATVGLKNIQQLVGQNIVVSKSPTNEMPPRYTLHGLFK